MSYRMIIADDEYMLIQLIKKLGRFKEMGIEIVDECHDGEETCRSILEKKPDFVLTDIQMPVYDGLEIVERVRQTLPDTLFVLISGYRVFEYARSAIQLNVVDYLLKPVNGEQLNAVLERLCRMTDENRQQKNDQASLASMKRRDHAQRMKAFWEAVTSEETDPTLFRAETLESLYGLRFRYGAFLCAALDCDLPYRAETDETTFQERIRPMADQWLTHHGDYWGHGAQTVYYLLLNFEGERKGAVRSDLAGFLAECQELKDIYGDIRIHLALSTVGEKPSALPEMGKQLMLARWGRLVQPGDTTVRFEKIRLLPRVEAPELYDEAVRKQLGDGIRYVSPEKADPPLASAQAFAEKHPYIYPEVYRSMGKAFRLTILENAAAEEREPLSLEMDRLDRSARTVAEYFGGMRELVRRYLHRQQEILKGQNRQPVEKAARFVRQNYMRNISLEAAAEASGVTPTHLSRIFKEQTGEGFNEFLTRIRLEASKKLLSGTRDSIREIAGAVGYADEKYFSRLFRKEYGIKPTEYRKLYG